MRLSPARRATLLKALRQLVQRGKVKRIGSGIKGDPYRYQIAGTEVPDIYGVPENQNPKNEGSDEQQRANAGTGLFTSGLNRKDAQWNVTP
jgi:hypothetical protein